MAYFPGCGPEASIPCSWYLKPFHITQCLTLRTERERLKIDTRPLCFCVFVSHDSVAAACKHGVCGGGEAQYPREKHHLPSNGPRASLSFQAQNLGTIGRASGLKVKVLWSLGPWDRGASA